MAARGSYAKGVATREDILDVALRLFADQGYEQTSVREVARVAGLSQAGLLHHFHGKSELFVEALRRRDLLNEESFDPNHGRPVTVEGFISIVRHNSADTELVKLFVTMSADSYRDGSPAQDFFRERYQRLTSDIAGDIRRQQSEGRLDVDIDPDRTAKLLVAAADGLQLQWLLDPEKTDMGEHLFLLWSAIRRSTAVRHEHSTAASTSF